MSEWNKLNDDTLYIDSNEPDDVKYTVRNEIQDRNPDVRCNIKGLKTGDFVYKDLVIERKDASDLASSIKDNRLKEQALRMRNDFTHNYVIIEGDPYDLDYSHLHRNAVNGTQVSLNTDGINTIRVDSEKDTAYVIHKLINEYENTEEKVEKLSRTTVETEDPSVAMLSCVEGISAEKARKIFKETWFESIGDIAQHQEKYYRKDNLHKTASQILEEVDGIGPTLSERIVQDIVEG